METHVEPQTELRPLYGNINKVFLVDASWLLHKSFFGYPDFSMLDERTGIVTSTGDIHGFLYGLLMIIRRSPDASIILCLDSRNNTRKEENSEYKADREFRPEIWSKLFEIIQSASLFPHVYLSASDGFEGDDVVYTLAKRFSGVVPEVLIYGYDKDLMQSVSDRCFLWNKCEGQKFLKRGVAEVKEIFEGCEPQNTSFFRSLCGGDSSDSMKAAYPRFPHRLGVQVANLFGCPENFLKSDYYGEKKCDKKWIEMLRDNPDPMMSVYNIMKSRFIENLPVYRCNSSWEYITRYRLKVVQGDFEKFLLFSSGGYVSLRL